MLSKATFVFYSYMALHAAFAAAAECTSVPSPLLVQDRSEESQFAKLWSADDAYEVIALKPVNGRKRFRIVGDILHINQETMKSAIGGLEEANTGIAEIIFDGREIYLDGPVSLSTGFIRLYSDELTITSRAVVSFSAQAPIASSYPIGLKLSDEAQDVPRLPGETDLAWLRRNRDFSYSPDVAEAGDGLSIVTRVLHLDHAVRYPFNFQEHSFPNGPTRTVQVIAEQISRDERTLQDYNEKAKLISSLTVMSPTPSEASRSSTLTTGRGWKSSYFSILSTKMSWPQQFATKVARFHARAPYDPSLRSGLKNEISRYSEVISKYKDPEPLASIERTRTLMQAGLDEQGFSEDYAPGVELSTLISRLQTHLNEISSPNGLRAQLDAAILRKEVSGSASEDQLSALRAQVEQAQRSALQTQTDLGGAITQMGLLEQVVSSLNDEIEQSRIRLAAELDNIRHHDLDEARIKETTQIVQVAAALLPVSAPIAIGISMAAGAAGDAVYRHNSNAGVPTPWEAIQTLQTIKQSSEAFRAQADKVKSAWDNVYEGAREVTDSTSRQSQTSGRSLTDHGKDIATLATTAKAFYDEVDRLYTMIDIPRPSQVKLNDLEQNDPMLQDELARLQKVRSSEAESLSLIAGLRKTLEASALKAASDLLVENDLLSRNIENDLSSSEAQGAAVELRAGLYHEIYREVSTLRRAALFANGSLPDLDPTYLYFSDGSGSVGASELIEADTGTLKLRLADDLTRTQTVVGAILHAVSSQQEEQSDRRTHFLFYPAPLIVTADSPVTSSSHIFIEALNEQIKNQILRRLVSISDLPREDLLPLVIPSEIPVGVGPFPEKFVDAVITDVEFEDNNTMVGKDVSFTVIHPGYGSMNVSGSCYYFDLRNPSNLNDPRSKSYSVTAIGADAASHHHDYLEHIHALSSFPEEARAVQARPPLHTTYSIVAQVFGDNQGASWRLIPRIKEITITLVAIQ